MRYVVARTSFIRSGMALVVLWGTFFVQLSKVQAAGVRCERLFEPSIFAQKPDRLYDYYTQQIALLSNEEVQGLNRTFVEILQNYTPPVHPNRAQAIDSDRAKKMLNIVYDHPTVGFKADEIYMHPGEEMGFCFGRAMYLHLLALKLGLQKESIKKIWAVGPMQSDKPGIDWGYHVALLVFSKEGWVVLDPNKMRVMAVADWVKTYSQKSLDGRIRFYGSDAEKFGLYSGKYSRYMLGLDLNASEDWYKHYFVDMLQATRHETLQSLGLTKIDFEEGKLPTSKSFSEMVMGLFGL